MPVLFSSTFGGKTEPGDLFPSLKEKKRPMTGDEMMAVMVGYYPKGK